MIKCVRVWSKLRGGNKKRPFADDGETENEGEDDDVGARLEDLSSDGVAEFGRFVPGEVRRSVEYVPSVDANLSKIL